MEKLMVDFIISLDGYVAAETLARLRSARDLHIPSALIAT
jgi:hypothetical protein